MSALDENIDIETLGRTLHRPRTAAEMRAAIAEMAARGMGAYEIAGASGLSVEEVRRLVALHRAPGEATA
jgi:hypothetical protein